jgi:beta-glucosidase
MFRALDDRVRFWVTLNEPWVVMDGGYLHGVMAPGHRNVFEAPLVTHNLLRAHASAVRAYRAIGKHQIGLVVNLETKYPASDSEEDRQAVKRADAYMNRQYLDPVYLGSYPPEMKEMFGEAWPEFPKSDLQQIREPFDFLGINYYFPGWMQHDPNTIVEKAKRVHQPQLTYTETAWPVFPQGLTDILTTVTERYGNVPIYITENGAAFRDPPSAEDGRIDDPLRIQYLRQHLLAARAAMRKGVDLRGYFAWSLLDNFEWQAGFSKRFGLIHVNYADQKRTIKQSGYFYRDAIARGFP